MKRRMLDSGIIRIGSAMLLAAYLLGALLLVLAHQRREGRRFDMAAGVPIVAPLQVIWPVANTLVPLLFLVMAIAFPHLVYETQMNLSFQGDSTLQVTGFALFFIGGFLSIAAARHLGRFMVIEVAVAKDHRLVTSGPYSRIRHPTYTALLLISFSLALFLLHLALFLNFLIVLGVANYRARLEEGLLASERGFGQEYEQYMARTGRFLPRLKSRGEKQIP